MSDPPFRRSATKAHRYLDCYCNSEFILRYRLTRTGYASVFSYSQKHPRVFLIIGEIFSAWATNKKNQWLLFGGGLS